MNTELPFSSDSVSFGNDGLVPTIIQDSRTMRVLMLGYMNRESLDLTLKTNKVTFYSRSRKKLWVKGETSGNGLKLKSIRLDCDSDALLVLAEPKGPTCHTGETSCFFKPEAAPEARGSFLFELQELLQDRKKMMPEGSYTTALFTKGLDKIAQKVGEEAVETVIAAKNEDVSEFLYESSDLLFHLMVLLTQRGYSIDDLIRELQDRQKPS